MTATHHSKEADAAPQARSDGESKLHVAVPTVLSLASGGGGLDAGVHLALGGRARTVCYVENEITAASLLVAGMAAQLLDEAPVWSDLRTFDGPRWRGLVDGIIGGYPCQPFSVAGRRHGVRDPRHLWPYIATIIRAVGPRWCFFENVGGHLRLGFREVAEELHGMGYRVAATLVRAEEVGAPHRRERLFILAVDDSHEGRWGWRPDATERGTETGGRGPFAEGGRGTVAYADEQGRVGEWGAGLQLTGAPLRHNVDGRDTPVAHPLCGELRDEPGRGGRASGAGAPEPRDAGEVVAHADERDDGGGRDLGARRGAQSANGNGAVGNADLARLEGRGGPKQGSGHQLPAWPPGPKDDDGWAAVIAAGRLDLLPATPQPAIRGVADGRVLARTDWLRILGNGVVPEQAAMAFKELAEALSTSRRDEGTARGESALVSAGVDTLAPPASGTAVAPSPLSPNGSVK